MRLKKIYRLIKEVAPIISSSVTIQNQNNSNEHMLTDWHITLVALEKIRKIEMFNDILQELYSLSPMFGERKEILNVSIVLSKQYTAWHKDIVGRLNTIIELCSSLGYDDYESSFEVKLPETKDFTDFANNVDELNKVFQTCTLIRDEDSSIQLSKTDIGSTWLEFFITGAKAATALAALGYIAQAAIKIKSMYLTCEQQKEAIRGAEQKNNLAEDIVNLNRVIIKSMAASEVKNIETKIDKELTPEDRVSMEKSIEILGKLMSKGLEIYATLDAPPEARDVFPSVELQKTLPLAQKLLENNTNK